MVLQNVSCFLRLIWHCPQIFCQLAHLVQVNIDLKGKKLLGTFCDIFICY